MTRARPLPFLQTHLSGFSTACPGWDLHSKTPTFTVTPSYLSDTCSCQVAKNEPGIILDSISKSFRRYKTYLGPTAPPAVSGSAPLQDTAADPPGLFSARPPEGASRVGAARFLASSLGRNTRSGAWPSSASCTSPRPPDAVALQTPSSSPPQGLCPWQRGHSQRGPFAELELGLVAAWSPLGRQLLSTPTSPLPPGGILVFVAVPFLVCLQVQRELREKGLRSVLPCRPTGDVPRRPVPSLLPGPDEGATPPLPRASSPPPARGGAGGPRREQGVKWPGSSGGGREPLGGHLRPCSARWGDGDSGGVAEPTPGLRRWAAQIRKGTSSCATSRLTGRLGTGLCSVLHLRGRGRA